MANILIADADQAIQKMIADSLQDLHHTFYYAEDGNKAMEMIQKNSIQIVLADKEITGKDGMEILEEMKKIQPRTPVIIMVGIGEEDADELLDAGAFATLSKPFNLQDVRRIINEAVPLSLQALAQTPLKETQKESSEVRKARKFFWIILSSVLSLLTGAAGLWFYIAYKTSPIKIFTVPYANISGMTFAGKILWTCDWFNQSIYQHQTDALLSLNKTFTLEDDHPTGIAWDGQNLWSVSSWRKKIVQHQLSGNLKAQREFVCPVSDPSCLYFDGESFWTCDSREAKIVHFTLQNNQVKILSSTNSPGQKPIGISKDKKVLWTADSRSGLIYKHRADQNLKVIEVYSLPEEVRKEKISCFTANGQTFWIGTENSQKIFQLHRRHLQLIGTAE